LTSRFRKGAAFCTLGERQAVWNLKKFDSPSGEIPKGKKKRVKGNRAKGQRAKESSPHRTPPENR
jgi:hypothetical protein